MDLKNREVAVAEEAVEAGAAGEGEAGAAEVLMEADVVALAGDASSRSPLTQKPVENI